MKDKNGRWLDPNKIPTATKQSLHVRSDAPKTAIHRALPGSALPGRRLPPSIFPPEYTPPPDPKTISEENPLPPLNIQLPLPGSGQNPNIDPILSLINSGVPTDHLPNIRENGQRAIDATKKPEPLGAVGYRFPGPKPNSDPIHNNPLTRAPSENQHPHNLAQHRPPTFYSPVPDTPYITDVKALAKLYTREALETLVEIMHDPMANANARVNAAENVLNRGWGKPELQMTATIKRNIEQFSDEEIMAILSSASTVIDNETQTDASTSDGSDETELPDTIVSDSPDAPEEAVPRDPPPDDKQKE